MSTPRGHGSEPRRAGARDGASQHRLADPVHGHVLVAGERDLLLARRDRRPRARSHAARVPDRGGALHGHRDDVRRGRVAAPGPRRLDGVRALRVQRARQLHRRLGDPARLRDPDRRHGVLGDAVPEGLLEPARPQRRGARPVARVHRARRARQHPRLRRQPRATRGHPARGRPRAAGVHRRARARAVLQPAHADRPDPPRHRADVVAPAVRDDRRGDRVHEPRVGVRASPARCGSAAPA